MMVCRRYTNRMQAKKSLGQNFLMHAKIAEHIAIESGVGADDVVLEIGPGTGMLTAPLLARAKKVIAVEADRELIPALAERFAGEIKGRRLELINADIREFGPSALHDRYHLVANIPYYLTGEIIRTFLSAQAKPASVTILVQKEVAERVARDKKGSILSIAVRAFGEPSYLFTVPRGAFLPAPNIDSAVLHIKDIRSPFASLQEEKAFFEVLRTGFAHKRKRLAKNLEDLLPPDSVLQAFTALSISPNARAEELSIDTWKNLARALTDSASSSQR